MVRWTISFAFGEPQLTRRHRIFSKTDKSSGFPQERGTWS
jgi:hypothetical protein